MIRLKGFISFDLNMCIYFDISVEKGMLNTIKYLIGKKMVYDRFDDFKFNV